MVSINRLFTSLIKVNLLLIIIFGCSRQLVLGELNTMLEIEQGVLSGVELTSVRDNSTYVGFLDIPYAKPPIGDLRFRDPQPPGRWNGTLHAKNNSRMCFQRYDYMNGIGGSEDCLLLNVYTTKLPEGSADRLRPVMVWIHGGAFEKGSAFKEIYGPDYLILEEVLIVTVNYRLGLFGFLNLNHSDVSNNIGLKDQVAALRWVQKNIVRFGGDPSVVTIFGESAGAASVHFHMLSPLSKGLFHRAIAQSGSALNSWASTRSGHERAVRLAKAVGCGDTATQDGDMQHMVDCLRNVSAKDLIANSHNHTVTEEDQRYGRRIPFLPTTFEAGNNVDEVFLHGNPLELLKEGKFRRVPFMAGMNSKESIIFVPLFKASLENFEADFERLIPQDLLVKYGDKSKDLAKKIKQFYFANESVSLSTISNLVNMTTDTWYMNGIYESVKIHAALSTVPVYLYQFDFNGELNVLKLIANQGETPGAGHGDEVGYLFKIQVWDSLMGQDSPEMKTSLRMVKLWTNFAKTGDPSSERTHLMNVTWPPVTPSKANYLQIGEELAVGDNLNADRFAFWEKLYKEGNK